jgi:hypothetical protein
MINYALLFFYFVFRIHCGSGWEKIFLILLLTFYCLDMDVDGDDRATAAAAAAAAATAESLRHAMDTRARAMAADPQTPQQPVPNTPKVVNSLTPGSLINQCSNAKKTNRNIDVLSCSLNEGGPVFNLENANIPRIGEMFTGETDLSKLYHGARLMKGGAQCNEVITASFDPATLSCLSCGSPHSIFSKTCPTVICFADQNFIPCLPSSTGSACLAVLRVEDAGLQDLASIAMEVLDNCALYPGSVILIGSGSHLYKEGTGTYASDWVKLCNQLGSRFRNINICPLIPLLQTDCPGAVAREMEMLAIWLLKCYNTGIKGFLDSWKAVVGYAKANSSGGTVLQYPDLIKIPLPKTLSNPDAQTTSFKFDCSCPVLLSKMDQKTHLGLVQILLHILQRDFSITISPEVTLLRATNTAENLKDERTVVCIGSSIMKQTVPFLQALGYNVIDLSYPGWLATEANISALKNSLSQLNIAPGCAVVFDLLSNCSLRYLEFDGTQSLAQKEGGRYHMKGPVTTCSDDTFSRIIKNLSPVLLSAQAEVKISIPPLPRYIFNPCCQNVNHCTNLLEEGHGEKILNGVTKLRHILKKECAGMGVENHWILDGVGAVTGIPPGQSGGCNREMLPEIQSVMATDGVHFRPDGNRNLAKAISAAITGMRDGSLSKSGAASARVSGSVQKQHEFFWRGFNSPVGDLVGRASAAHHHHNGRGPGSSWRGGHNTGNNNAGSFGKYRGRQFHPYKKRF